MLFWNLCATLNNRTTFQTTEHNISYREKQEIAINFRMKKEHEMEKIRLRTERCKGCYLCMANCKVHAISLSDETNSKGVIPVKVDQEKCVQCGSCYTMCPDLVFEIL